MKRFRTIRSYWNSLREKLILSFSEHPIRVKLSLLIVVWCLILLCLSDLHQHIILVLTVKVIVGVTVGLLLGIFLLLSFLWNKLMHNWKHRK